MDPRVTNEILSTIVYICIPDEQRAGSARLERDRCTSKSINNASANAHLNSEKRCEVSAILEQKPHTKISTVI